MIDYMIANCQNHPYFQNNYMRDCLREFVLLLFMFLLYSTTGAQRNGITTGLNATYLSDWKHQPFIFFNPEVGFSKGIKDNISISCYLNVLYGQTGWEDINANGDVFKRLWFNNDFTLDYKTRNLILSAGPSFRYRNEVAIMSYPISGWWDNFTDPQRAHFDFGAALRVGYQFKTTEHNFLVMRLSYRVYTAGVNPLSLGAFYNFTWKKKNSK